MYTLYCSSLSWNTVYCLIVLYKLMPPEVLLWYGKFKTNTVNILLIYIKIIIPIVKIYGGKVKWFRYRPGVAQTVDWGIALLFHDGGTGRGWVVSSTPRPHFTPGKDPVHILQEAGWAPGPVWTGEKSRPGPSSPKSVAIPTELPSPHIGATQYKLLQGYQVCLCTYIYIYIYIYGCWGEYLDLGGTT